MKRFAPLALLAALSSAQAANPAPLNGIWTLTASAVHGKPLTLVVTPELFIVSGSVHGRLGCGSFEGQIEAAAGHLQMNVVPLPPKPTERCLYALPNEFHAALNEVNRYVISRDTKRLVLFSGHTRLTFQRIGYVTPAKK